MPETMKTAVNVKVIGKGSTGERANTYMKNSRKPDKEKSNLRKTAMDTYAKHQCR